METAISMPVTQRCGGNAREKTFAVCLEFTALIFTLAVENCRRMEAKLGLACTLVGEPKVLLLDEPGVGVDPISRREDWQMVTNWRARRDAVAMGASYLDEAEQCRDIAADE